jgi:hypothetical protein
MDVEERGGAWRSMCGRAWSGKKDMLARASGRRYEQVSRAKGGPIILGLLEFLGVYWAVWSLSSLVFAPAICRRWWGMCGGEGTMGRGEGVKTVRSYAVSVGKVGRHGKACILHIVHQWHRRLKAEADRGRRS